MGGPHREYHRIADHQQVAARAKAVPGEWQRVGLYRSADVARAVATQVRTGRFAAYAPAGRFQAYQSVGREGRGLWVRYVHGITPPAELPEYLPEAARVVMAGHLVADRYVSARWAADLLAAKGYAEDADRVRAWHAEYCGGRAGARQAAAYLLQHDRTTREDTDQ